MFFQYLWYNVPEGSKRQDTAQASIIAVNAPEGDCNAAGRLARLTEITVAMNFCGRDAARAVAIQIHLSGGDTNNGLFARSDRRDNFMGNKYWRCIGFRYNCYIGGWFAVYFTGKGADD